MKKIIILLVLCMLSLPAIAENSQNIHYEFFDGEFGIRLPASFFVIHENITSEELAGTGTSAQDALEFLNSFSTDLYAAFDDDNGYLSIQTFKNAVSSEIPYEGFSDAKYLAGFWMQQLEKNDYTILFFKPYVTEDDCFGKVAFMFEADGKPVYCLDYITIFEKDLINLSFSSHSGQFDIEDEYLFDTIASSLYDSKVTLSSGT